MKSNIVDTNSLTRNLVIKMFIDDYRAARGGVVTPYDETFEKHQLVLTRKRLDFKHGAFIPENTLCLAKLESRELELRVSVAVPSHSPSVPLFVGSWPDPKDFVWLTL